MDAAHTSSVAILHDNFPTVGGAERVVIEAARILDAPIYTAYVSPDVRIPSDVPIYPVNQSKYTSGVLGRIVDSPGAVADQMRTWSLMLDLSDIPELNDYDVILESNHAAKHYTPSENQSILNYVHTLPQYYYNLYHYTLEQFDYPVVSSLLKLYIKTCRLMDKEANDYVDRFIANSEVTKSRLDTYYDRSSEIVYPPIIGDWRNEGDNGYYVTWSRLSKKKRIVMIARAFERLDERLIIAGDGPEKDRLRSIARGHDNIEIRGYVDDIESLVANATAVIYAPVQEPFGMVGAEALRAGKPIIGVSEGFLQHHITPETGRTFDPDTRSLVEAVRSFDPAEFDPDEIQAHGERFDRKHFEDSLLSVIGSSGRDND
jgi:glycosyltransferase involved in cell wall biosynthesis